MDIIVNLAEGFMGLFDAGAETFVGWVTSIIPRVLLLLIFMNALIALIGQDRINKFAKVCSKNVILAYGILPFLSAFMLGNPMALSMGKFLPERMKPSYYASASYHCHTNSGMFPHINVGEIFIYLGIADGISTLGLSTTPLAVRYMLVGLVMNFFAGWVTDFTTKIVMKQQKIELSKEL
ncbi:MAG: glucitol/sorbitol-specific PTS transporter subunit IIC [Clostridiales bacterium]|uniref:Glucitol/sorbitol-specific PTS transporter subunit IIC n=1 Tax=Candidatus Anaerobutyricum stercoripullorum TaxID=2838456 RepID=A0A9D1X3Y5_9FIRM|nr:glucitol/sorbitol-specific PTS transporter subunit IIC [Clostridiales bacterium]HIX72141.1 glucitol/sorbitol-specific PTS transporter subunit IIC [Candidatus Anaerobutyricum stercoripullorum]